MRALGIDLGASKTVMASLCQGEPLPLLNREGSSLLPTVLGLGAKGELLVGHAALAGHGEPARFFLPRLGEAIEITCSGRQYTPSELTTLLLARLRDDAEATLHEPVGRVAFALPLACSQRQVAALCQAAQRAGLLTLALLPAPVAAALAYCRSDQEAAARTLLVADFGAASLDVTVLRAFPGALTVLGQAGETWLGGEDLTQSIVAHLLRRLQGQRGLLLDESLPARQALRRQLRQAAEQAKVALSIVGEAGIHLALDELGLPAALDEALTRAQFEELAGPRLEEAAAVVERALQAADLAPEAVDAALLLGGSAQLPLWRALLRSQLPRARLLGDVNPLLTVATGAALWAGMRAEVRCPTCGLPSPLQARACRRCSTPLAGERRLVCPRCALPNEPGRPACSKCGASLRRAPVAPRRPRRAPGAGDGAAGLRCRHCGLVGQAGSTSCPACGELLAPFVGLLSYSNLGIERQDGHMDVVLAPGQPLPTARPVHRAFAAGAGQRLEVPLYEGDKPFACQNQCSALLCVAQPEDLAPGAAVRVAFSLDPDGRPAVEATRGDGIGGELDAWLEWR